MNTIGTWIFVGSLFIGLVVGVVAYLLGQAQEQRFEREAANMRRYLDAMDRKRAAREQEMLDRELSDDGVDR